MSICIATLSRSLSLSRSRFLSLSLSLSLSPASRRRPVLPLIPPPSPPPVDLLPLLLCSPTFFLSPLSHLSCAELLHIPSAQGRGAETDLFNQGPRPGWAVVCGSCGWFEGPPYPPDPSHSWFLGEVCSRWAHFQASHHCLLPDELLTGYKTAYI